MVARGYAGRRGDAGGSASLKILWPSPENIELAAKAILRGELVVVPTETVYGLAANALDPDAVQSIFVAKQRPSWNPLIVHVSGPEMANQVGDVSLEATTMMERFWPGPLSLVLPDRGRVAAAVRAGGSTVAVRQSSHPVLQQLVLACGVPLAAPSANLFTRLSPTRAEDISDQILKNVFCVLDGGRCEVGIESTVLDLTVTPPEVLRLGHISIGQIQEMLPSAGFGKKSSNAVKSPGQSELHYSPQTSTHLVTHSETEGLAAEQPGRNDLVRVENNDSATYAKFLYATLSEMDRKGLPMIYIEAPPVTAEWAAVWDRLRRLTTSSGEL